MNSHPYLKTYMAGVLLPSWLLLVGLVGFVISRTVFERHYPIEQVLVFPMAVVPNLWGLWNVLYVALVLNRRISLGLWGALLPLLLIPGGFALQHFLGVPLFSLSEALTVFPIAVALYYLAWKHVVGFFNQVVGVR
jgi:hypothetical protein